MVTKELVVLARCLREVDGAALDSLEDRITFQKRIYLLQVCGIDLGYRFEWDLYGPYSPGLAVAGRLYEANRPEIDQAAEGLVFTDEATRKIERARKLIENPRRLSVPDSTWLEMVSSLHLVATVRGLSFPSTSEEAEEEVRTVLFKKKPHLQGSEELVELAWQRLNECASS